MCDDCGCALEGNSNAVAVELFQDLNDQNNAQAHHNRAHFQRHGVLCINLMSSPGSGKTRLLQTIIPMLTDQFNVAVIEGDLETENDAQRIRETGVQAYQINTSTACHLDAQQIHHALHHMPIEDLDILFIENVGNLVCPAGFDLGQHKNVVLLACTEGDDKPAKYPVMFQKADLVLFSKSDLLSVLDDFSVSVATDHIRQLANTADCLSVSGKTEEGLGQLVETIKQWQLSDVRIDEIVKA
jgi:hydrogenase nickel incorporation protein HypB